MKRYIFLLLGLLVSSSSFSQSANWKAAFDKQLPLLGHRNWILIVDKAFPAQTAPGIEVLETKEDILPVSRIVLEKLKASDHVKPVIYTDKELEYLTADMVPQINDFRDKHKVLFSSYPVKTMLHESVFSRIDEASRLFRIIVLKTNTLIPYSSVFIELDCKYWNDDLEKALRKKM